jgi:hypothetical protein
MSDDVPPLPDEDTAVPPDPFEAELVAYLDGELDAAAARKVEARLAADPGARAKAAALKKTFDLLDYLPKPDPSPNFTTRTLDRLPAMKSGPAPVPTQTARQPAASSSVPIALATSSVPTAPAVPARPRWGMWAAGVLAAVAACAAAGYFVSAALRPAHTPGPANPPDNLLISDRGVIENLPLYAAADDLDFVRDLAGPEYFGDDPAVSFDAKLKPPQTVEPDGPSGPAFDKLAQHFKALPPARQQAVRELDKQLRELPNRDDRDRLFRVLEVYAVWLDRLPPTDRKGVLAATTGSHRLGEIRELRERQWIDSLPPVHREKLTGLKPADKAELIGQWRKAEAERREEWDFVREHADDIAANRVPWPFDDPARRREVVEFVRVTFHTDDSKKSRLTANEFDGVRKALAEANEKQGWAWHAYGKMAYDLARKYEFWLLPEPAVGEPVTRPDQLKQFERFFDKGAGAKAIQDKVGKWPDFALEVHRFMQGTKAERMPPLGPAKPGDFKEPLRGFVTKELGKALSGQEKQKLDATENRWPDYPREVVRLAKQHNLSAPGLMLPGPPRQWEATYRTNFGPSRGFGPRP